jgi:hypothetical protein
VPGEYAVVVAVAVQLGEVVDVAAAAAAAEIEFADPAAEVEPEAVAEQQVVVGAELEHAEVFEDGTKEVELQAWGRTAHFAEDTIAAVAAPAEGIVHGVANTAVVADAVVLAVELLTLEQEVTETVEEEVCEQQPEVVDKASPI